MTSISASWSSLTFRAKRFAKQLLLAVLILPLTTLACGPEYSYWFQIEHRLPFDPLRPSHRDSARVFYRLAPEVEWRNYRDQVDPQLLALQEALDASLAKNRPGLFLLSRSNRPQYANQYCFAGKYKELRDRSIELASHIEWRFRRQEYHKIDKTRGIPPRDYYPDYDKIPGIDEATHISNSRGYGPQDKYNTYYNSAVRFSDLSNCVAELDKPRYQSQQWTMEDREFAESILEQMREIPEYATTAGLYLMMGYIDDGRIEKARRLHAELKNELAAHAKNEGPLTNPIFDSHPTGESAQQIMADYEQVLADKDLRNRPRLLPALSSNEHGWGSCASNSFRSASAFALAAVNDKHVSDDEVADLVTLRKQLLNGCYTPNGRVEFVEVMRNRLATPYHRYLLAAGLFYTEDYDEALALFTDLARTKRAPWISETSLYLQARTLMRASQKNWNGYEPDDAILREQSLESGEAFRQYVKKYPSGLYADSAKGLIRRAHKLGGEPEIYQEMLREAAADMFAELDNGADWADEEIAEFRARFGEFDLVGDFDDKANGLATLEVFIADAPAEGTEKFRFIERYRSIARANTTFISGDFNSVVEQYAGRTELNEYELALLARAHQQRGDVDAALEVFAAGLPNTEQSAVDYTISEILYKHGGVESVVVDSRLGSIAVKRAYLASLCDESLQIELLARPLAVDVAHAVFVDLALRYINSENFASLHALMRKTPRDVIGDYAAIRTAVRHIATREDPGKGYMNIAYFLQMRIQVPVIDLDIALRKDRTPSCRQATLAHGGLDPYYFYNRSLAFFDEDERSESEEKSLHYITTCFKQGVSCMWRGNRLDGLSSKEAYTRLHTKYKGGKWAERTKYYY